MHFWRRIARKSRSAEVRNNIASESMEVGKRITEVIEKGEVLMVWIRKGNATIWIATQNRRTGKRGNKKGRQDIFRRYIYARMEK
jgi:hypothetical protein